MKALVGMDPNQRGVLFSIPARRLVVVVVAFVRCVARRITAPWDQGNCNTPSFPRSLPPAPSEPDVAIGSVVLSGFRWLWEAVSGRRISTLSYRSSSSPLR